MRRCLPICLLLAGCPSEDGLVRHNEPPEITLTNPAAGAQISPHAPLRISAYLSDDATPIEGIAVSASSSVVGPLEGEVALSDELWQLTLAAPLPPGPHTLSVRAVDSEGAVAEASVSIEMVENRAPTVVFLQPSAAAITLDGDDLAVRVQVTDDAPLDGLSLQWADDAAGLGPPGVDADGYAAFTLESVPPGPLALRVVAADAAGLYATASVSLDVTDADRDDDGHRALALGGDDCDDTDPFVFPGASERCNGEDDDCDGDVDEGVTDPETWYRDADGDGRGLATATVEACEQPAGYAFAAGDCDDTDAQVRPGAPERCNGEDDDCDGQIPGDESTDADADGHRRCEDCNDSDPQIRPGAPERCNGLDDDCDGVVPPPERSDGDGDGSVTCADCADDDPLVRPGAPERCNGLDDDCDGALPPDEATDADGDGARRCVDCDDEAADVRPGAPEACDLVDQDCDGQIDESACAGCAMQSYAASGAPSVYQFCATALTWQAARAQCRSWGYRMVSIQGSAEDAWVHSVVDGTFPQRWWLGAADELVEGSFGWEDGAAWSYTNWAPGEPNNINNEDCVELNGNLDGTWNDAQCGQLRHYICEAAP
jgi:hypothetical protein